MARVVVRKGYRSLPGRRRELLAALQRKDALAAEAGWPRGRYLSVETRAPGEPDLEVEFAFESYADMEQLERRLRERLARAPREVVSGEQEFLLEPSATRYLLLLDDSATAQAAGAARRAAANPGAAPPVPVSGPTAEEPAAPRPSPATPPDSTASSGGRGQAVAQDRRAPTSSRPAQVQPSVRDGTEARRPTGSGVAATGAARVVETIRSAGTPNRGPAPEAARSPAAGANRGAARGAPPALPEPPELADDAYADDNDPFLDEEFEPVEEHATPPPPEFPGLSPAEAQARQLASARAALAAAERAVQLAPEGRPEPRDSRPGTGRPSRDERRTRDG